ncbi:uncharacterized protein PAC_15039 [Phialocephala subalpina]|uniref:Uncharacterized protein n=1 Tax=Phialocephala subalpina TaxID=576137 RepID=A0A1L7XJC3_9HELO|nr:uncharacterized protein PAC_15039 [Phialocephala subalpina]
MGDDVLQRLRASSPFVHSQHDGVCAKERPLQALPPTSCFLLAVNLFIPDQDPAHAVLRVQPLRSTRALLHLGRSFANAHGNLIVVAHSPDHLAATHTNDSNSQYRFELGKLDRLSEPTANMKKHTWSFACKHQYEFVDNYPFTFGNQDSFYESPEKCPVCKDKAVQLPPKSPQDLAKNDEQTVAIWQKQSTEIQAHIKEAKEHDNKETVKDLEVMLKNCNALWLKKIVEIAKRDLPGATRACEMFEDALAKTITNVTMVKTAEWRVNPDMFNPESRYSKLKTLDGNLAALKTEFGNSVQGELAKMEQRLESYGKQFLKLISDASSVKAEVEGLALIFIRQFRCDYTSNHNILPQAIPSTMSQQQIWTFSCGHALIAYPAPILFTQMLMKKTSSDECPSCREISAQAILSEQQDEIEDKNDEHPLAMWKKQTDFMKANLEESKTAGNAEMTKHLQKLLGKCNILWAAKVTEIERKKIAAASNGDAQRPLSVIFKEAMQKRQEKANLLLEAEKVLSSLETREAPDSRYAKLVKLKEGYDLELNHWVENFEQNMKYTEGDLGIYDKRFLEIIMMGSDSEKWWENDDLQQKA